MIDLSARSILFDLRVVRQLLRDDRTTLFEQPLALEYLERVIERIEDFGSFYEALQKACREAPEADLGPDEWDTRTGSDSGWTPV